MFRSVKLQTYRDEEHQNGGTDAERFEKIGPHVQDGEYRRSSHPHPHVSPPIQPPEAEVTLLTLELTLYLIYPPPYTAAGGGNDLII